MRKLIETVYGSQYEELIKAGKDGNKARFNGNLFLSAYVIVFILLVMIIFTMFPEYNDKMNRFFRNTFGGFDGKALGKILAVPLFASIYFVIRYTIGTEESFRKFVDAYMQYSEEEKKKDFKRMLLPFMTMLGLMLILSISSLF